MENTEITLFCIVFACNQGWIGEVRDGSYFVQCDLSVFNSQIAAASGMEKKCLSKYLPLMGLPWSELVWNYNK